MSARKRDRNLTPLVLAAVALLLMAGPRALTSVRAGLPLALVPFRSTASAAHRLVTRDAAPPDELARQLEYFRNKTIEQTTQISELRTRIEEVTLVRGVLDNPSFKLLTAGVIVNADSSAWRRSIVIARGSSHGVARGQIVLWERHLVGRVAETGPWTSRVQLVSDPAFKAGAVSVPKVQEGPALSERDTGVFEGSGDRHGVLKWVAGETTAEEGALVVTTADPAAGMPRGLVLGRVAGVSRSRGPYPRVEVQPFVNPRAIESVVVVLEARP